MSPRSPAAPFATNELFRYALVRAPRIIDLEVRAKQNDVVYDLVKKTPTEREAWAKAHLAQKVDPIKAITIADLKFQYGDYISLEKLPSDRLPMAADLLKPKSFDANAIRNNADYKADRNKLLIRVTELRLLQTGNEPSAELMSTARLLDLVENFPNLPRIRTHEPFATVVLKRAELFNTKFPKAPEENPNPAETRAKELKNVAEGIHVLWRAANRMRREKKADFDKVHREILREIPDLPPLPPIATRTDSKATKSKDVAKSTARSKTKYSTKVSKEAAADALLQREMLRARTEAHSRALKERSQKLTDLKNKYATERETTSLENLLKTDPHDVAKYSGMISEAAITSIITAITEYTKKHDIPTARFCEAYETAIERADAAGAVVADEPGENPTCFSAYPDLVFDDTIRILGEADLIRVDETFVKYSAGEISYVENVLAGEVRKRQVKSTRYFEQSSETVTEDSTASSTETSASTKQELKSQVETELKTRLETDINASASGSGGGSIGLVRLQGSGAVDASLGVGLDTGLNTSNDSQFSQEIINKALERTKNSVIERRMSRSYSLDETRNLHKLRNDQAGAKAFNGVYCFLNKHLAITERVYGRRLFLLANIRQPGRSLICARMERLRLAYEDLGAKPIFDISPADITPANYMTYAGRFKAQNITPPPAPVVTLGRTYKTDTTNASSESQEFNSRKVAEVLVPYFEKYKRFLLADNIKLPDGYEVMDVTVTVNHGMNGISIPADLPLRAGGAVAFAAPAIAAYSGYGPFLLPVWLWHIGFLASPLLHYNCDSSNVTVSIGTESQDSPYYFFDPESMIREIFSLIGSISAAMPSILQEIEASVEPLLTTLADTASRVPGEAADAVTQAVRKFITSLKAILEDVINLNANGALEKLKSLGFQITTDQLRNLQNTMGELFEPFRGFIQNAIDLISNAVGTAILDLLAYYSQIWENSQTLSFTAAQGTRGELPVSFNTVAIKPGITINMSACLRRTKQALAQWQLDTFSNFYRAHLQLLSDYESKAFIGGNTDRIAKPPAMFRAEEQAAVKERVLLALNNVGSSPGRSYTFDRMNFFEHALDWENMSYRTFNYGPTQREIELEKRGLFNGVDDRRRAFTTSLWAQVMIPVEDSTHFVQQVMSYFENGTFSVDGTLQNDELVALYRDFVLGRETEPLHVSEPRFEMVPTEFIVLKTPGLDGELPRNPDFPNA